MKKIIILTLLLIGGNLFAQTEPQVKSDTIVSGIDSISNYNNQGIYYGVYVTPIDSGITFQDTIKFYEVIPKGGGLADTNLLSVRDIVTGREDTIACSMGAYDTRYSIPISRRRYLILKANPYRIIAIRRNVRTYVAGIRSMITWEAFKIKTSN